MTTQPQPDRITANEIRELFASVILRLDQLESESHAMRGGLQQAATAPAPTGDFREMVIDTIIMTYDDNGKPAYKGLGAPFQKFGVRIWDEVLPQFTDPATLKPGKNAIPPAPARVLMNEAKDDKPAQPRKVTGKI